MELLTPHARALDPSEAIAAYRRDGFAVLRGVASDEALEALRARADDLMLGRVDTREYFYQHDTTSGRYDDLTYGQGYVGPSLNYRKIEKLERDELFRAWIENALFERIARAVVGEAITLYRAILMAKAARGPSGVGGTVLPWHQDAGAFWGVDRDPELQLWTALDDAPAEAGCVAVLPGSHRWGLATPLGGMVPADRVREARADEQAVLVPARAGDVVLIHNLVWHASGTNATDRPRRGVSACYLDAATRCVRKKRAPRTFTRLFAR